MHRPIIALLLLAIAGCAERPPAPLRDEAAFGPVSMRLHPVFTRIKDWTGDDVPDGIEAMVEFQDAYGDPTKASGRIIFELFQAKARQPDPRGRRLANPWIGSLLSQQDQQERWNRASRTYTFPLAIDRIDRRQDYVLTAQFDGTDGRRFFDRLVIEGARTPRRDSTTAPTTREAAR